MIQMFSLILPVYNEEHNLSRNLARIVRELSGMHEDYEIIIAEDGSTDRTLHIARERSGRNPRIRVSHSDKRLGKGLAIRRAVSIASGDRMGFMDIDLSTDIRHLGKMLECLEGHSIVIGSRMMHGSRSRRRLSRHLFSLSYNSLIRLLFRSGIRDHQCGFKGFRREAILALAGQARNNRWFFDTELLVIARRAGFSIKEIPVEWDEAVSSKVMSARVALQMLTDMIRFLPRSRSLPTRK